MFAADQYVADIALKALMTGAVTGATVKLALDEATEADLIAAKNAVPAKTHDIDTLIKFVRAAKDVEAQAAAAPLRVEITNASDFAEKDTTVLRVERDSSGKLTGAMAHKI